MPTPSSKDAAPTPTRRSTWTAIRSVGATPGKPSEGRDATKDTLGREPGPGSGGEAEIGNSGQTGPPPGVTPATTSNPAHNMGLVSGEDGGTETSLVDDVIDWLLTPSTPPDAGVVRPDGDTKVVVPKEAAPPLSAYERQQQAELKKWQKKQNVDPDADGGGGAPTEDDLARAIAVHGADTDFVEGHGTHIDGSTPPKRAIDLVTDGGDEDPGAGDSTTTVTPPGQQISRPVNPQDGLPGSAPPGSGTGGGAVRSGGGGGGGDGDGLHGGSAAATAATADTPSSSSGVINIGSGSSGGGIQTTTNGADDDVTGLGTGTASASM